MGRLDGTWRRFCLDDPAATTKFDTANQGPPRKERAKAYADAAKCMCYLAGPRRACELPGLGYMRKNSRSRATPSFR